MQFCPYVSSHELQTLFQPLHQPREVVCSDELLRRLISIQSHADSISLVEVRQDGSKTFCLIDNGALRETRAEYQR